MTDIEQEIYKRVRKRAESCAMTMLLEVAKHYGKKNTALDQSDYCAIDVLSGYLEQASYDTANLADALVYKTHDLTTLMKMSEVAERSFSQYLSAFMRFKQYVEFMAA
ncbi:MAG: hypothetical protein WDA26_13335 [Pusillimonas sp.]